MQRDTESLPDCFQCGNLSPPPSQRHLASLSADWAADILVDSENSWSSGRTESYRKEQSASEQLDLYIRKFEASLREAKYRAPPSSVSAGDQTTAILGIVSPSASVSALGPVVDHVKFAMPPRGASPGSLSGFSSLPDETSATEDGEFHLREDDASSELPIWAAWTSSYRCVLEAHELSAQLKNRLWLACSEAEACPRLLSLEEKAAIRDSLLRKQFGVGGPSGSHSDSEDRIGHRVTGERLAALVDRAAHSFTNSRLK